jgi:methyl-accepting chemotaxis protein
MKPTIGRKLGLGFALILALTAASTILQHFKTIEIRRNQDYILNTRVPSLDTARKLQRDLNQVASKTRQIVLAGSQPTRREDAKKLFNDAWGAIGRDVQRLDALEPGWVLQTNRDRLAEIKQQLPILRETEDRAIERAAGNEADAIVLAGNDLADKAIPVNNAIKAALGDMADSLDELLNQNRMALAEEEASLDRTMATTTLVALGAGVLVAIFLSRTISRSILALLVETEAIAAGDLTRPDMEVSSHDELGDLTVAVNRMSGNLKNMIFSIAEHAAQVAGAGEELNATSQQITANSEETSAQANVVSTAAQQVSQNLQTVATGAEEMGASIKEIAKNATEAARVATGAVRVAETTTATVSKLGDSSTEIGQVIKVITSIAQQTNLLALNATIEAARAGEAGKGFAVVANEVKELAKETAEATEDISRKIEAIQVDTKAAVDAIASISGVIHHLNDISGTIASAVEEQNATTNEMSRNVSDAARGSGEITSNIAGVAQAAESTSQGAGDTQKALQQLVETSAQLRRLVEQFKIEQGAGANQGASAKPAPSKAARAGR